VVAEKQQPRARATSFRLQTFLSTAREENERIKK